MKDIILLAALSLVAVAAATSLGFLSKYLHAKSAAFAAQVSGSKANALLALGAGFLGDAVDVAVAAIQKDTANGVTVSTLPALGNDLAAKYKAFLTAEGVATLEKALGLAAGSAGDVLSALVNAKLQAAVNVPKAG